MNTYAIRSTLIGSLGVALALASGSALAISFRITSLGPLPPVGDLTTLQILEAMQHDKKVVAGRLHFVLPTTIGATAIVDDVTRKELKASLKRVGFKSER